MNNMKRDLIRIQELVGMAFSETGSLVALTDGGQMNPNKLQKTLEQTMEHFERSTLELRQLCERYSPGVGGFAHKPVLPAADVAGSVESFGYGWLHITLHKIMLEELPEYKKLKKCSVFDYVPEWKKREEEGAKRRTAGNRTSAAPPAPQPSPASGKRPDMQPQTSPTEEPAASGSSCGNDNMTPEEIGLVEMTCEAILEGDDPELEEMDDPTRIPPGRGI